MVSTLFSDHGLGLKLILLHHNDKLWSGWPVEEIVCDLCINDHASFVSQDLTESWDAVGHNLWITIPQHLIENIDKIQLFSRVRKKQNKIKTRASSTWIIQETHFSVHKMYTLYVLCGLIRVRNIQHIWNICMYRNRYIYTCTGCIVQSIYNTCTCTWAFSVTQWMNHFFLLSIMSEFSFNTKNNHWKLCMYMYMWESFHSRI